VCKNIKKRQNKKLKSGVFEKQGSNKDEKIMKVKVNKEKGGMRK